MKPEDVKRDLEHSNSDEDVYSIFGSAHHSLCCIVSQFSQLTMALPPTSKKFLTSDCSSTVSQCQKILKV